MSGARYLVRRRHDGYVQWLACSRRGTLVWTGYPSDATQYGAVRGAEVVAALQLEEEYAPSVQVDLVEVVP